MEELSQQYSDLIKGGWAYVQNRVKDRGTGSSFCLTS